MDHTIVMSLSQGTLYWWTVWRFPIFNKGTLRNFHGETLMLTLSLKVPVFLPKVKIEIAAPSSKEKEAVEIIKNTANTGRIGDGKIFVFDIERTVRIRTGEEDEEAL